MAGKRALPIGYVGTRQQRRVELRGERVTGAAVLAGPLAMLNAIQGFAERAAPLVRDELERIITTNVKAERGPDGKPWPAMKDGGKALQGAMKAVKITARGTTVVATVTGIEARHNAGAVKGARAMQGNVRKIIPSLRVPGAMAEAIQSVVDAEAARLVGGGA